MTSCRHHSGYLADDEAGHTTYVARVQPPKKSLFPEMGQASKLGHTPHPTSMHGPSGSSGLRSHRRNPKGPRPFRSFLDFLVEGQVLDSLQTVVEEATERMATVKTEAGVPLVEVEDPMEVPRCGRRARARPILSTVHQRCTRPSLCLGRPNNYPSCSSSMSDSHSSFTANWPGSHSWDSNLGARSLGALPPMKDKLLLEKNLKRLLQLENRRKGLGQSCPHGDSLPWDSLGSQTSSQWTLEQPLSWFSGLLGSSSGTPEASEVGPAERELIFLKRELNKEMKSLLSQPGSFDLPGYCALREPHRTLDFLAEHHLFPALQDVVNQAVDKLSGACRRDGCPLFPSEWEPSPESSSKLATPIDGEEPYDLLPTTTSSPRMEHRKSIKYRGRGKAKEGGSPVSSTQVATRFRLEVTPTEEPKSPSYKFTKKKTLPSILSKSTTMSRLSNPWHEELVDYLKGQAVSLLACKYRFEKNLTGQLGFISFPITEALLDLFLGFRKVKGSRIRLSSTIDWSCLLRRLEEAEFSQWSPQRASRHTSQHSTPQRSMRTPTAPSELAARTHRVQDKPTGSRLNMRSPGPRPLASQEHPAAAEQEPTRPPEPKLFLSSANTGVASHQSDQTVNMEDHQSIEEEEEDKEEDGEEEEEDENDFGDEGEPQSSPEPQEEAVVSTTAAGSGVGHGDCPWGP
ncbi:coiled-coil domain-containing protein 116 isoform X1 [Balaenoptera acutorostrata]|uniref:Coiled-coil domain-containing protein 116 isoform X1 n=1 Tax=Balaenoptera acutorostrata TaxID=9767 RepID=A0ABM3S0R6_BALAC|nr:coiled-coil domain-containing protein 116 isoform X1 [Balaenoptera acutorostrata]